MTSYKDTIYSSFIQRNFPRVVQEIFEFARNNEFDEFTTLAGIRDALKRDENFVNRIYKNIDTNFSFFNSTYYKKYSDFYDLANLLFQIKEEIMLIKHSENLSNNDYILRRQLSPPMEVFEPIGNNNLKITDSKRAYGLLYE